MDDTTFSTAPPDGVWDSLNKSAGLRLKRLRKTAGMTPSDLMHRLRGLGVKLHPTQLGRVEAGTRPLKLEEAHAVASIFGISMAALVEETDDLEIAALELQQRDALSALSFHRETYRRFHPAFLEFQQQMNKISEDIERSTAVVHETEQRIAAVRYGEADEDSDEDEGFEEVR